MAAPRDEATLLGTMRELTGSAFLRVQLGRNAVSHVKQPFYLN
jgi:hypothetical protein